jgi:hypothetical protein
MVLICSCLYVVKPFILPIDPLCRSDLFQTSRLNLIFTEWNLDMHVHFPGSIVQINR